MSAVHPAFAARRFRPARVVAGALRVVTALLLLGILVGLVALIGQGRAGAREPDRAAAAPGGTDTDSVPLDPRAVDAVTVAEGQARTLLAQLGGASDREGWVPRQPLPASPGRRGPDDAGGHTSTLPPVGQMTLTGRFRPEQGPAEHDGARGAGEGGGERGAQGLQVAGSPAAGVAAGREPTLMAQVGRMPPGKVMPGPGRGQVPDQAIGDPEPINYEKAAEGKPVVLVIQNPNVASEMRALAAALPPLEKLGFRTLTMDNLPTSVDPNDRRAVRRALFADPPSPSFEDSRGDYLRLYDQAKKLGMRVRPAYGGPVLPEEQNWSPETGQPKPGGKYVGWVDKSAKIQEAVISDEVAAGGKVVAATDFPIVGYPKDLWPGNTKVNILLAEKGIPPVVWKFVPEGESFSHAVWEYQPWDDRTERSAERSLQRLEERKLELLKEYPGGFMMKVYGKPDRESERGFDWLIVPGPGARRGGSGEPGQEHDPLGPRYGETPPTAPPGEEHAALPTPPQQLLEPLSVEEPDGQLVEAQAAGRPLAAEQGTGPQAGAPASNDGFTTVSDGLQTGPAGPPPIVFGNDLTGQPSTAAAGGDAAPVMAAMAGTLDNVFEVSETAEVSTDPPAQMVVADEVGAGEDGLDNSGDRFASDFASDDASFGFG